MRMWLWIAYGLLYFCVRQLFGERLRSAGGGQRM